MKVFTVGLDEKPPIKDAEKALESPGPIPGTPPPIITLEKKSSNSWKRYLMCMLTVFLVLLFAIILSELAYNRARDENYLRLRWAELRQRMAMNMGYENNYNNLQPQPQPLVQQIYQPDRVDSAAYMQETTTPEATTTTTPPSTTPVELPNPIDGGLPGDLANPSSGDPRLEFLRKILSKIREEAEKAGIDGTMQVSVMRVDQPDLSQVQEPSFTDGFGEIQQPFIAPSSPLDMMPMPKMFGPWPSEDFYNDNDENRPISSPMMMSQPMDMSMPSMMMSQFASRPMMMMMNQPGNLGPMMMNSGMMPRPFSAPLLPQILFMGARRFDQPMLPPTNNMAGSFGPSFTGPLAAPAQPHIQPQIIPQDPQPQLFAPNPADASWNINDAPQQMQQQILQAQPQMSNTFIRPFALMQLETPQQEPIPVLGPQLPQPQQPQIESGVPTFDQAPRWLGPQFPINAAPPPPPQSLSRDLWSPIPKSNIADNFDQRMNGALVSPPQMPQVPQIPQNQQSLWNPDMSWMNNEIREQPQVQFASSDSFFKPADNGFPVPSLPEQFQAQQQQMPIVLQQNVVPQEAIEQPQTQVQAQQPQETQFVQMPEVRPVVSEVVPAVQPEQSLPTIQQQQEQQPLVIPTENTWQKPQPIVPVNGDQPQELVQAGSADNKMEMQGPQDIAIISPRMAESVPFFQSKMNQEKIEMPVMNEQQQQQVVDDAALRIDQKPFALNPVFLQVDEPGRFDGDTVNVME